MANKKTKQEDKSLQLTIMLILVSSTYIIVYIPVIVVFVVFKVLDPASAAMTNTWIAYNYTKVLYIFGFAINFLLYTVSGRVFREQLQVLLCERNLRRKHHGGTTETTTLV